MSYLARIDIGCRLSARCPSVILRETRRLCGTNALEKLVDVDAQFRGLPAELVGRLQHLVSGEPGFGSGLIHADDIV
jgi:hypothetical protein